jgi:hypothetical protein
MRRFFAHIARLASDFWPIFVWHFVRLVALSLWGSLLRSPNHCLGDACAPRGLPNWNHGRHLFYVFRRMPRRLTALILPAVVDATRQPEHHGGPMRLIPVQAKVRLPAARDARLTGSRLRRPTRLPTIVPTTPFGRYLRRLSWLFGGP